MCVSAGGRPVKFAHINEPIHIQREGGRHGGRKGGREREMFLHPMPLTLQPTPSSSIETCTTNPATIFKTISLTSMHRPYSLSATRSCYVCVCV